MSCSQLVSQHIHITYNVYKHQSNINYSKSIYSNSVYRRYSALTTSTENLHELPHPLYKWYPLLCLPLTHEMYPYSNISTASTPISTCTAFTPISARMASTLN